MKKSKTILPVRGIRTPAFLLFCKGLLHKLFKTGELDETNVISSGYVTGQIKRFRNACLSLCQKVEEKLQPLWSEADRLLIDLERVNSELDGIDKAELPYPDTPTKARAAERRAGKRAAREAERQTAVKRLSEIKNSILTEHTVAGDRMAATAELLLSSLSKYGHGLLLRPVNTQNLPTIRYEDCAKQILQSHEDTWYRVLAILESEVNHEK